MVKYEIEKQTRIPTSSPDVFHQIKYSAPSELAMLLVDLGHVS